MCPGKHMMKLPNIRRYKVELYIGLTMLILGLIGQLFAYPTTFLLRALNEIFVFSYIIFANIILFHYTIPRLSWNRFFKSLILLVFQFFLFSIGLFIWRKIGIGLHIYTVFKTYTSLEHEMSSLFGTSVGSFLFFGIVRHIYYYIKLKQSAQQLLIEKQQAELNYLKSQTNPHFLFNTLNNIYSLSRDKSDLAPESILRLSKILRFMLYEAGGKFIAIEEELKIIGDYIDLEKLRYDDSLRINYNYNVEDMKQAIPPLLLIPLVENAFKHGVSETRHLPFVDIHLSVKNRQLVFVVRNSNEEMSSRETLKENIGLSNLRRQLALLYKEYDLSVTQADSVFTVRLAINLISHA